MTDTITTESTVKFDCGFVDGDTRVITMKNPRDDITTEEITELNAYIRANNLLVGDKTGAIFAGFQKVRKGTNTTRQFFKVGED